MATQPQDKDENESADAKSEKKNRLGALKGLFKNKKILIGALAGVLVLAGASGAFLFFSGGHEEALPAKAAAATPHDAAEGAPPANLHHYVDLPEMTVNLASSDVKPQFLRVKITLEVPNTAVVQNIQPLMPRILDVFQVYLRELRSADIEGSAGIHRLKEELTRRVNQIINPEQINSVLFKEMLVQ